MMDISLQTKILFSVGLIIFVVLGTSTFVHIRNVKHGYVQEIGLRSEALAQGIVKEVIKRKQFYNQEGDLEPLLRALSVQCMELYELNKEKNVKHFAVIDASGMICAHNNKELWNTLLEIPILVESLHKREQVTVLDGSTYHTFIPMFDDRAAYLGTIDIGISRQVVDENIQQFLVQSLQLLLIFLVSTCILVSLFVHLFVTKPLRRLVTMGKKIAKGEFGGLVTKTREPSTTSRKKTARDEIRVLTEAFHEMISYFQEMTHVAIRISAGDLGQEVFPRSQDDMLGNAFQRMSGYLHEMTAAAAAIAVGDLRQQIHPKSQYDVLGNTFRQMIVYIQQVADVAEKISDGDLRVKVIPESEQDVLNRSLKKMITYIQNVANVAENIANNNLQIAITPGSHQDTLTLSLQRMVTNLQSARAEAEQSMNEVQQQNWLRTGQAELSETMRGEQDLTMLANRIITYLAQYLQAQIGTIYLTNEQNGETVLQFADGYGYADKEGTRSAFKLGEGVIGQAALQQKSLLLSNVPEDYLSITAGLGEIIPRYILVAPFMYDQEVKGVIELGTAHEFTTLQRDFFLLVQENIAIAIHAAQSRVKMQKLLAETQHQAEILQSQEEGLRQANTELAEQTKALKVSEEKLQAQQEELRQTNETLEEQARTLETQKAELEEKNLALERARQNVEENAREIENAKQLLEEKMRELERSEKYKSEFLANMSHELRTPLSSLLILAKLLYENKEETLTDKQVEFARTIHAAGSDLLELINEVLDLSKVETGKMILNIEEMSISGLIPYITQHFAHMAEEQGLYLKVEVADALPASIRTDRQRVEQIMKNFLSNALKFTEKGGVSVQIGRPVADTDFSRSGLGSQQTVAITVSDTGIGIPKDKQHMIFGAFQQLDGTVSRKYGGTGLGLSISQEFARLLGGEIHVHSEEGKGSTFILYLPEEFLQIKEDEQQADRIEQETAKGPLPLISSSEIEAIRDDRHETSLMDKSLLIVEDDPKFAKVLFDLARERGFKGLIARDGEAGLQMAYQYNPSAIILDSRLPRMNGWVVMEKLRRNPETRHIPVHFVSSQEQPHTTMQAGAIGYMTKPVKFDELQDAVNVIEDTLTFSLKKLLVAVDNKALRTSLLKQFSGEDIEITTVKTDQEAYARLKTEAFDGIVVDLGLAKMSGFDLIDQIQYDPLTAHLPIIITHSEKPLAPGEKLRLKKQLERTLVKEATPQERVLDEVILFLHRVEAALPEEQQKKVHMVHDRETVLSGKTILLVDDDMRNLYALTSVLEEHGMNVLMAVNGKEALTRLDEHAEEIDLVVMDIMMPEIDGYEAIRTIRKQQEKFSRLPIIALTAKAMRGDRQKCIEAGANDYLSKPADIDKLLSLLRVWLY